MNIESLKQLLTTDIVTVIFTKKDGSKREMVCTTISDYLPPVSKVEHIKYPSEKLVTVWDLEANGWRSFNFDSVLSIETDYFNYTVEK